MSVCHHMLCIVRLSKMFQMAFYCCTFLYISTSYNIPYDPIKRKRTCLTSRGLNRGLIRLTKIVVTRFISKIRYIFAFFE